MLVLPNCTLEFGGDLTTVGLAVALIRAHERTTAIDVDEGPV